jgi:hypothetical protein
MDRMGDDDDDDDDEGFSLGSAATAINTFGQ